MRIVDNVEQQILQSEDGRLFFVSDFATSGNDVFISRLLSGFVDSGLLCRLSHGIYYKPVITRLGILYPEIPEIVKAIARRDDAQILPTGETAQNILGLSTQMPMNHVYLTSGSARKLMIGTKTVTFKRCVPKNFTCRNEFLAILIQAMKSIGKDRLTDSHKATIRGLLQKNMPIESFEDDLKTAPVWARRIISNIVKEIENEKMD
jgi:hypothetical protein